MEQQQHETYYVPEQSKFPLLASLGLFLTVFTLAYGLNTIKAAKEAAMKSGAESYFEWGMLASFFMALAFFCVVIYQWFATAIDENIKGLNNAQLKRSYVWGMGWFIFSEVMFFAAFFGALFYIRTFSLHELADPLNKHLWDGFIADWPVMTTPDMAVNGAEAQVKGPEKNMSNPGLTNWTGWLPFWNTVILMTSSVTVHMAHVALKNDKKSGLFGFNSWLGLTVALGIIFLFVQAYEYIHAYRDLGLKLDSGIYGTTFFLLTGFHGLHVTMGTFMLLVQWLRSVLKNHFSHDDCFGFEASSWYWHFVDVVWVGLFLFVYILG